MQGDGAAGGWGGGGGGGGGGRRMLSRKRERINIVSVTPGSAAQFMDHSTKNNPQT